MAGFSGLNRDTAVNNNSGGGGNFIILEEDDYELEIVESEIEPNSKSTGHNFNYKVQVVSGPFKGTSFFSNITSIVHESAQAQGIGQGQLKALFEACGGAGEIGCDFHEMEDSEQLHLRPFWAHVIKETYTPAKGKYAGQERTVNKVEKFLWEGMPEDDAGSTGSAPPAQKSAPREAPPPAAAQKPAGSRPWGNRAAR